MIYLHLTRSRHEQARTAIGWEICRIAGVQHVANQAEIVGVIAHCCDGGAFVEGITGNIVRINQRILPYR